MTNPVTYHMAMERLRAAGADHVADILSAYRNVDGGLGGWDGFVRKQFSRRTVAVIWPEEGAT